MLGVKTTPIRLACPYVIALGVSLGLSGCELRLTDDTSSYADEDYGGATAGRPGGSTRVEVPSPYPESDESESDPREGDAYGRDRPERDAPEVIAPSREPVYDGPGISRHVELIVLDPRVVQGSHASNADRAAPWSFRAQMGWLAGGDADALAFTVRWMDAWESLRTVGTADAPVSVRPGLRDVLLRPWLGNSTPDEVSALYDTPDPDVVSDPDVAPDPDVVPALGSYPPEPAPTPAPAAYGTLPASAWAAAPFRLIAIVNRVDLALDACGNDAGELRYVYTATDARAERALDLSVIVEIPYPRSRSAAGWARAWQGVAAAPAGAARDEALLALTREVAVEADPLRVHVRTNEAALSQGAGPWQMRDFELSSSTTGALDLRQVPLAFTPRADADLAQLAEHLLSHSDAVLAGGSELPESLRAGAAEMSAPDFSWRVPGISERLRSAFSGATCNGCHAGDTGTARFQHIAPGASYTAPAQLSRFLYDESAPTDELRRRATRLLELSATACPDEPAPSAGHY
jgi:hypothetical protein